MLLIAALLFTFSFLFNKLYINRSSVAQEVKLAEKYIHDKQDEFASFCKDTGLINRLLAQAESLHEFNQLADKRGSIAGTLPPGNPESGG